MSPTPKVPAPEISVVIPTYNRSARIVALLETLRQQTLAPERFEVVVVDNCSTDDTSAAIGTLDPTLPFRVLVHRTPVNKGPAPARNLGWRTASAPLLAFLDDDCTPAPGWLEAGLAALGDQPAAGVIQGRTHVPDEVDVNQVAYGPPDWEVLHAINGPTPQFETCNIFYRREVMEKIGGFDEGIGWWGEDTAAGWRALQAGWEGGFAFWAEVTHPVEQRGWGWFIRNGLNERNLIGLAVELPAYRAAAFWRPWAYRKEEAALVAAVVGAAVGLRFRPALLLALPYLWWRRPSVRHLSFFRLCFQIPILDAARISAHLRGSVEQRTLVL
jgi:glycosyltransferase involved in cell wall biosynthesis